MIGSAAESQKSQETEPVFEQEISVSQQCGPSFDLMIAFMLIFGLAGFALARWIGFDISDYVITTFLVLVSMFFGLFVPFLIREKWMQRKGIATFQSIARIRIDVDGLAVDGLGQADWRDILSYETIPDSDHGVIVRTGAYGSLLLDARIAEILPVLDFYMDKCQQALILEVQEREQRGAPVTFVSQVFNWPQFRAKIILGYVLAALTMIAMTFADPYNPSFVVGAVVVAPLIALAVWIGPLVRLRKFANRYVHAFVLDDTSLKSTDGRWQIDLGKAEINFHEARGIGYQLRIISICPHTGKRLDLLPGEQELQMLLACLPRH